MSKTITYKKKLVIIGCGNVAWHLCKHLSELKKYQITVYNHQANSALTEFKKEFACRIFPSLEAVMDDADYYLVAVSDSNIAKVEVKVHLKKANAVIIHTSGSVELSALGDRAHNGAVMYPLQTFTKSDAVNWKEIPIIVEADNEATRKQVSLLAHEFSNHIIFANYKTRLKVHLAAVLVNNFSNALYAAALDVLTDKKETEISINTLLPLIHQTVKKIEHLHPLEAQTGPAKRGDELVIEKHLDLLAKKPELRKVYKQLSKLIVKQQGKQHA
ncbi:MAG: DUF2520 domain-containing protein [Bacteroidia bacterium]|nr:DUF2520 domain-containing protein [Bacteroidia bacterium]